MTESFQLFKEEHEAKSDSTNQKLSHIEETVKDFKAVSDGTIQGILVESQELRVNYSAQKLQLLQIVVQH